MSQVMYLDSDSMPLSMPDDYFYSSKGYVLNGSMFFPEVWRQGVHEASTPICPILKSKAPPLKAAQRLKTIQLLQSPVAECYELLGLEVPWLKGPWGAVESGQFLMNL